MLQLCIFWFIRISVIHPADDKLPSIREICSCMLVYAYENEVLKKIMGDLHNVGRASKPASPFPADCATLSEEASSKAPFNIQCLLKVLGTPIKC